MKAKFWLLPLAVLIIVNIAWVLRFKQTGRDQNIRMNDSRSRLIQINRELYLMNRGWEFSLKSNDQSIPEDLWVQGYGESSDCLSDCVGESRKLVLVLSDSHCSSCVDQLLFMLKNEIAGKNRRNLLILFSKQGPTQDLWTNRQKILAGVDFVEIHEKSLHLPVDSLEIPYFFMVGPERMAGMTYTPYPSLEAQTKAYLSLIENRYFN